MYWIRRAENLEAVVALPKDGNNAAKRRETVGSSKTDGLIMQYNKTKNPEPDYWDSQYQGVGQQETSSREVAHSSDAFG